MKAFVYQGPGKKALEQRPKPDIAAPTDAIVKMAKTTICGTRDVGQIVLDTKPHHQPSGMPAASDEAAERRLFGRLWVHVKALRIKPLREGNDLIRLYRDVAEGMNVAFDIVLEVAIVDGVRKSHEWFWAGISPPTSTIL
jgi:hypothetical protein